MQKIVVNNYSCDSNPKENSCGCIVVLSGDCIKYVGNYLSNLNVQSGETFNKILVKINNLITAQGLTEVFTMDSPTIVWQGNGTESQPLFAQVIGGGGVTPSLQEVTDVGNTTTNSINVVNTVNSSDIIAQSDSNSSIITAKSGGDHNVELYVDMTSDQVYCGISSPGGVGQIVATSSAIGLRLMNNGGNEAYINRGASPTNLVFKTNDIATNTMYSDGRMSGTNAINSNEFITKAQLDANSTITIDNTSIASTTVTQSYMNTNYPTVPIKGKVYFTNLSDSATQVLVVTKYDTTSWSSNVETKLT